MNNIFLYTYKFLFLVKITTVKKLHSLLWPGAPALPKLCVTLLILTFLFQGCAIGPRIVTEYDSNSFANNPLHEKVLWTYAWGLIQPKDLNPGCEVNFNHLNMVEVKTNIGFILLSAVTLGVVVPVKVKWDCAPPPVNPGTLGDTTNAKSK